MPRTLDDWLSARLTLAIMGFFMFLVTQMIRVNLYIALVAINDEQHQNLTESVSVSSTGLIRAKSGGKHLNARDQFQRKSNWNENASGLLLGAFYWSYWATELPGGLLAHKFGGRKVLGAGVTTAAILNLLLPLACRTHYLLASFLRALQGLALVRQSKTLSISRC